MTGELERCLSAGMDALLAKPLEDQRLRAVLERFGANGAPDCHGRASILEAADSPAASDGPILDIGHLQEVADGDGTFITELCRTFVASATRDS